MEEEDDPVDNGETSRSGMHAARAATCQERRRDAVNAHFITRLLNGAFTGAMPGYKRPNSSGIRGGITGK